MSLWNSCQRVFVQTCGSIQLELFTRNAQFCSSSISAPWPSWPPVFPTGSVEKRQRCGHSASYSGHLLKLAVGLCGVYCTRAGLVAPVVGQTLFGDTGEVMVALMILRAVTLWHSVTLYDTVTLCDTASHIVTLCDTVWLGDGGTDDTDGGDFDGVGRSDCCHVHTRLRHLPGLPQGLPAPLHLTSSSLVTGPVRAPGRNAPLIQFLASALYIGLCIICSFI